MSNRTWTARLFIGVLVVGLLLAGCGPAAAPTAAPTTKVEPTAVPTGAPVPTAAPTAVPTPKPGGDLRVAMQQDANVLNPYLASNDSETFCVGLIYDTLLGYDSENAELLPGLADSWEWEAGNMSALFHLNKDAKWQDGEDVTADDVVFSFTYLSNTQFPIFFAIASNYGGVEKVDDDTVRLKFNYPQVDAPRFIGTVVSIIPEHIWKDVADGQSFANLDNPVGSGPFRLKERAAGQYIVLEATHSHYRLKPTLDTITIHIVSDETVAVLALKNGDFDVLGWDVSPDIAVEVRDKPADYPNIQLATTGGLGDTTLIFNLRKAPYDNVDLRRALAQAVDTDTIIQNVLLGFADPLGPGFFPPAGTAWYDPNIPAIKYDPEAAKAALEAAGFKDVNGDGWREQPDGSPLTISILCTVVPSSQDVANFIAADFGDVGIQTTVEPVDPTGLRPRLKAADFDAVLSGISLSEPGMIAYYLGSSRGVVKDGQVVGFNYGGYASTAFDEAATASRTAFDKAERQQLLYQCQEILAQDLPQLPLYIPAIINLYRDDRFSGWVVTPGVGVLSTDTLEALTLK